ncbi:Gfo/Idh/MocA family oxidoreductase [Aliifodinibius salicampi]|uniref:Gfo/Idh/MocA family oxidoreductase n=1 Tax=Fodinibius salicampi TaxID=1920655 RepID=A0ABT3Q2M2_9BACT|nr:Gfo/Idh/MocA family oxidoreductase [Fodinibius salicampi]MCW9714360.1 Gfo/Idh/MocA family oxidoreductase [Fodinibius salicampi]
MSYSRRDFLAHLSLGLGSIAAFPSLSMLNNVEHFLKQKGLSKLPEDEKLGIALVGLGNYSSGQLAPALQETKLCKLSGIVTGTPQKEQEWAQKYNIPDSNIYNYETYDQIADNDDIDIIYVVLPNSMHAEYTIRAAEAGKHVICEKPMATSAKDCQRMIDACNQANRKLSIGYRLHFEPHNKEMMRLGRNEVLGPVQQMSGTFSFPLNDPDAWRLDKKMAGGGPLMDVGIYIVQASLYTMGQLPTSVKAWDETKDHETFSEVEGTIRWNLNFPNNVVLQADSSYEDRGNNFRMEAANGWAELSPAYSYGGIKGETSEGPMDFPQVNQQALQMDDFARCIIEDDQTIVPGEMGKRDMIILDSIYESAETGSEVSLEFDKDGDFIDPMKG